MSDTPRTDAAQYDFDILYAPLARELERENAKLRDALEKLAAWGPDCLPDVCSKEEVDEYNRDHAAALDVLDGADKRSAKPAHSRRGPTD
jgi:hypothetical protein